MNILVCNDDGIDAVGIVKLAEIAATFGDVYVVAPSGQRSAVSHGITFGKDIIVRSVAFPVPVKAAYSVDGTPADCTSVGIKCLLPVKPDVVLSGINKGYNLGFDTVYSGTVGAAREGHHCGIKSFAISMHHEADFTIVDKYLKDVLAKLLKEEIGANEFWNINLPDCKPEELQGVKYCKLAPYSCYENYFVKNIVSEEEFHITPMGTMREEYDKDSDIGAILDGFISVSKIRGF